jgi:diadenosine tetraphosphate (Ap4A) HIT family hydrolase
VLGARPVAGTELFAAPDAAPVAIGHTLVFPRRHWTSFADYTRARQSWPRVQRTLVAVAVALRELSNGAERVLFFEHGGARPFRPGVSGRCAGTEHAHVHVLPMPGMSLPRLARAISGTLDARIAPVHTPADVPGSATGYVWLSDGDRSYALISELSGGMPRQLVRRTLLAAAEVPATMTGDTWSAAVTADSERNAQRVAACWRALTNGLAAA